MAAVEVRLVVRANDVREEVVYFPKAILVEELIDPPQVGQGLATVKVGVLIEGSGIQRACHMAYRYAIKHLKPTLRGRDVNRKALRDALQRYEEELNTKALNKFWKDFS